MPRDSEIPQELPEGLVYCGGDGPGFTRRKLAGGWAYYGQFRDSHFFQVRGRDHQRGRGKK